MHPAWEPGLAPSSCGATAMARDAMVRLQVAIKIGALKVARIENGGGSIPTPLLVQFQKCVPIIAKLRMPLFASNVAPTVAARQHKIVLSLKSSPAAIYCQYRDYLPDLANVP